MGSSSLPSGFLVFRGRRKFAVWLAFFCLVPKCLVILANVCIVGPVITGGSRASMVTVHLSSGGLHLLELFLRSAIISFMARSSFVVRDTVDVGACTVFMLLERPNTKSAESTKSSSGGGGRDIEAIICETHDSSRSIQVN